MAENDLVCVVERVQPGHQRRRRRTRSTIRWRSARAFLNRFLWNDCTDDSGRPSEGSIGGCVLRVGLISPGGCDPSAGPGGKIGVLVIAASGHGSKIRLLTNHTATRSPLPVLVIGVLATGVLATGVLVTGVFASCACSSTNA